MFINDPGDDDIVDDNDDTVGLQVMADYLHDIVD
jgi:hypothetical protein